MGQAEAKQSVAKSSHEDLIPHVKESLEILKGIIPDCIEKAVSSSGTELELAEKLAKKAHDHCTRKRTDSPQSKREIQSLAKGLSCIEACAEVAVDAVFFLLDLLGLHVPNQDEAIQIITDAMKNLGKEVLLNGLNEGLKELKEFPHGHESRAKALHTFLDHIKIKEVMKHVYKAVWGDLPWEEKVELGVTLFAHIALWFGTDGAALFAEVIEALSLTEDLENSIHKAADAVHICGKNKGKTNNDSSKDLAVSSSCNVM